MQSISNEMQAKIANDALHAKTQADVAALQATIIGEVGEHWRPVGDMEDNLGAINASSDARLALNERMTNGIDAVLELEARLAFGTDVAAMAREMPMPVVAAQKLLGVPAGGPGAMSIPARQSLAERVQLTLVESGVADRPTCVALDTGIGQAPSRVAETTLSIHRGNKRDKPFLMGVYGWGGSNALGFAEATVLVTRRHPLVLDGEPDGVAITIVRRIYEPSMRTPAYFFLVDANNDPLALDPAIVAPLGFEHGTHIAHVEYDLGIRGGLINQYNFFSAALFEPVMPVYLGSFRDVDTHPGRRTIIGTGGRLKSSTPDDDAKTDGTKIAYTSSATIELDAAEGRVRVNVWALEKDGAKPTAEIATGFVSADSAITVTLNGQRQETEKREWLKRECKFPHLYKRLVVQIEADGLTPHAKVDTFATTRERLRGRMRERIFTPLGELLAGDEQLQNLENKLREEALKHTAEKASDKDLEKLRRAIGKLGGRTREVDIEVELELDGPKKKSQGGAEPRDIDDSHLPLTPTKLEFDRHTLTIEAGGVRRRVMLSIDAKNNYLPDHEDDLTITVEGPAGETRNVYPNVRGALMGGAAQWLISSDESSQLGDYKLTAELAVGDTTLTDTIVIAVLESREPGHGGSSRLGKLKQKIKQKTEIPIGPQVNWVTQEHWDQYDYSAVTVGHVAEGPQGVDIYLNLDFDKLAEVLGNPKYSSAVVSARKSAYMVPTALGLYRIHQIETAHDLEEEVLSGMRRIVADCVLLSTDPEGILGQDQDADE